MWQKAKPYVISIAIALGVGGLSSLISSGSMEVYSSITRPPLSPPSLLFPIVWTVLYVLMGISSALIYTKRTEENNEAVKGALTVYALQLAVNFLWSIIFFNFRAYLTAFIWLLLLWVLIIVMIVRFRKVSPAAAYLQIPYLLWVTFAGYLNLAIFILNR